VKEDLCKKFAAKEVHLHLFSSSVTIQLFASRLREEVKMPTLKCSALGEPNKSTIQSAQRKTLLFCLYLCDRNIGTVFFV
jgi:hypothetical protein